MWNAEGPSGTVGRMNALDVVIGLLCIGSAVLGIALGPLRQISKLAGLVLGLLLAKKYAGWAQDVMRLRFAHGEAVAYVTLLVAVYVAARLVGYTLEYSLKAEKLSGSERLTGAFAGLVHGAALSVVVVFILVAVSPREAAIFRESKAAPAAIAVGGWVQGAFPKVVRDPFREKAPVAEGERERADARAKEAAKEPVKEAAKETAKETTKAKAGASSAPPAAQPKNRSKK